MVGPSFRSIQTMCRSPALSARFQPKEGQTGGFYAIAAECTAQRSGRSENSGRNHSAVPLAVTTAMGHANIGETRRIYAGDWRDGGLRGRDPLRSTPDSTHVRGADQKTLP